VNRAPLETPYPANGLVEIRRDGSVADAIGKPTWVVAGRLPAERLTIGVGMKIGCVMMAWAVISVGLARPVYTQSTGLAYPAAERRGTTSGVATVQLPDPYRWLETSGDSTVQRYMLAQDSLALATIRASVPYDRLREAVRARVSRRIILREPQLGGGRVFYLRSDPGPGGTINLYVREGVSSEPRAMLPNGSVNPLSLLAYVPSPDGSRIAVGTRFGLGTSWMRWTIVDVATGASTDSLEGAFFGSELVWSGDGRSVIYERFDSPDTASLATARTVHPRLVRHEIGTEPSQDATLMQLVEGNPGDMRLTVSQAAGRLLVVVHDTKGDRLVAVDFATSRPRIDTLIAPNAATIVVVGDDANGVWLQTTAGAPRGRIAYAPLGRSTPAQWKTIVPERAADVQLMATGLGTAAARLIGGRIVVPFLDHDLRSTLEIFDARGKRLQRIQLPAGGWMFASSGGNPVTGSATDPTGFFRFMGITEPAAVFSFNVETGALAVFERQAVPFDAGKYITERVIVRSRDGTGIPVSLTYRAGVVRDGQRPVFLQAYGAYGFVLQPYYQPAFIAFMDLGGIMAFAGVRGGGEYGEAWHRSAMGVHKQRSVDDLYAAAHWFASSGWTRPARIAVNGSSAGGTVAAALLTQHPNAIGAALIDYPVTDLVRYLEMPNGGFGTEEFGSSANASELTALAKLSPYHAVRASHCYPPTLLITSDVDNQAPPAHALKLGAALQHSQTCANPILVEIVWGSGHAAFGSAKRQPLDTFTDQLAFVVRAFGIEVAPSTDAATKRGQ
jgi:prolyl oligopeptidase